MLKYIWKRSDLLRVISGSRKGFKLNAPKGLDTRPTQDRIKESLFNIIGNIDDNSVVLDLFSGTGAIGIEFLSRGAKKCCFVDDSQESIRTIKNNLVKTKFEEKSETYKNNVFNVINVLGRKKVGFDFIFMDPPYNRGYENKVLKTICDNNLLREDGLIIIEHGKGLPFEKTFYYLKKIDERNYGDTTITFYTYNDR